MVYIILTNEERTNWTEFRVWASILFILSIFVTGVILFYTIKFIKLIGFRKKMLLAYLFCLCISAFGRVVAQIVDISLKWNHWDRDPNPWRDVPLNWANAAFFAVAIVINIFNWVYLTLRIEKHLEGKRKNQLHFHVAFAIFLILILGLYGMLTIASWDERFTKISAYIIGISYGATFVMISVAYAFVSRKLFVTYTKLSPDLANKQKLRLFTSWTVIGGSFLLRGKVHLIHILGACTFAKKF